MRVQNEIDRFHLVKSAVQNLPQLGNRGAYLIQKMNDKIPDRIKTELFKEMWLQSSEGHDELLNVFWNGEMPVDLQWLKS